MLASCLLMIHNTSRSRKHNVAELTRWQQFYHPFFEISETHIVSGGDDTSLVKTAVQLYYNFAGSVIVDGFEFANVTVLLHDAKELDNNLGAWTDENLSLSLLLGVVDGIKRIVKD